MRVGMRDGKKRSRCGCFKLKEVEGTDVRQQGWLLSLRSQAPLCEPQPSQGGPTFRAIKHELVWPKVFPQTAQGGGMVVHNKEL
jgi:hypothetical protein